jgi:hypothetical protein
MRITVGDRVTAPSMVTGELMYGVVKCIIPDTQYKDFSNGDLTIVDGDDYIVSVHNDEGFVCNALLSKCVLDVMDALRRIDEVDAARKEVAPKPGWIQAIHGFADDAPVEAAAPKEVAAQADPEPDNKANYIAWLENTLIPDLRESGSDAMAEEFEQCIKFMQP